jgi:predicted metal-dependent phosphoesterase TrpH
MGLADLHIHTTWSVDGTCSVAEVLQQAAGFTSLTMVAITDHDEIRGALEAMELAPNYGIDVVPGMEITTAEGHLLALYIDSPVPSHRPLMETLLRVGEQGGICIAAHPMALGLSSLNARSILAALDDPDAARVLVGIESFNAGIVIKRSNRKAHQLASRLHLAQVGGSDAHVSWMIGSGATWFPGSAPADLRNALENGKTCVTAGQPVNPVRMMGSWLSRYTLRRLGGITGRPEPQMPLQIGRPGSWD